MSTTTTEGAEDKIRLRLLLQDVHEWLTDLIDMPNGMDGLDRMKTRALLARIDYMLSTPEIQK